MAFQELIKNFDRLRDYMRDFFIYGFKTRTDFPEKSVRTYDNERRRIECYLGSYFRSHSRPQGPDGGRVKQVSLSMDSAVLPQNPLYQAYRCKSFTSNDILLHFFLLELLSEPNPPQSQGWTAGQLADALSQRYGICFDIQTVRGKLREYEDPDRGLGLLDCEKSGKALCYRISGEGVTTLLRERVEAFREFLAFFSETAPFGVVGSYLMERDGLTNRHIRFKHHFLAPALDDNLLLAITEAIEAGDLLEVTNFSRHPKKSRAAAQAAICTGIPIAILVSTQTGRRYLILYGDRKKRFHSFRLDYIRSVKRLGPCPVQWLEEVRRQGEESLSVTWGAAISWRRKRERLAMELYIDEKREKYVLQRLYREGRGGRVEQVGTNRFRYSIEVTDTNEMMEWVKTFTGRICKLEGDNQRVVQRFYSDMRRMVALYQSNGEEKM